MTESQLPAAATAQKFGTLIPNRIFGEPFTRLFNYMEEEEYNGDELRKF